MIAAELAVRLALFGALITASITSIEQLLRRRELCLFSSAKVASSSRNVKLDILLCVKLALSILLILLPFTDIFWLYGIFFLSVVTGVINLNRPVGGDGADQFQFIVFITITLCYWSVNDQLAAHVAALFLGFQLLLMYTTTGFAKLFSPVWRGGIVVLKIMETASYGHPSMAHLLRGFPSLNKGLTWGAIAVFCLFPLAFFSQSDTFFLIALTMCGLFHLSTGVLMGLNNFALVFPASYGCAIYAYDYVGKIL